MLDSAILRPGRFDRLIEVPEPDQAARERILDIHTRGMNLAETVDYETLARDTEGFSGAELESLSTEAGMFAIRDDRTEVTMADFEDALAKIQREEENGTPGYAAYVQ
ncbi:proteasome-activating AAA-ATPase (PAN), archaeal [Halarchaeum acidiphilum MH1-52-1]|uniref:Proteasome-activating AAA-ATPase (PAN), archaeal n=3 Tax=Halarchaeum acidiphilum TaxID=489138 RepID=U3ABT6_9EURY|nr:proteasome-activating AAA-ATPase (PAN), archaeal [Halarchaeum acidiphilum MH1-52-1]